MIIVKSYSDRSKNNSFKPFAADSLQFNKLNFSGIIKTASQISVDTFIKQIPEEHRFLKNFMGFPLSDNDINILFFLKQKCFTDNMDDKLRISMPVSLISQNINLEEKEVLNFIKSINEWQGKQFISMKSTNNGISYFISPELHELLLDKKILKKGRLEFESIYLDQHEILRSILNKYEKKEALEVSNDQVITTVKFNKSSVGDISGLITKIDEFDIPAKLVISPESKKNFIVPDGIKTQYLIYENDYNPAISVDLAKDLNLSTEKQALIEVLFNQQKNSEKKYLLNHNEIYRATGVLKTGRYKNKNSIAVQKHPKNNSIRMKKALDELIRDNIIHETRIEKSSKTFYVLNPEFYQLLKRNTDLNFS